VRAIEPGGTDLFVGTEYDGVFRSRDNGDSWAPINEGFASTSINALAARGGRLYAGTTSNGVWVRPLSELPAVFRRADPSPPFGFALAGGPLRPRDPIGFILPDRASIKLSLHGVRGEEAALLYGGVSEKGEHAVLLPGDLPPGRYYLRLESGGRSLSRRVVLER
jgi:hypothetical protein